MTDALAILRDPYIQVTYLFVTGVAAIYCLLGLWAATSRRHWFLRAIIPCLALAALIPIRAHEPLIFYALIMAEIVAALAAWRWWRCRRLVGQVSNPSQDKLDTGQIESLSYAGRFRFSLRDLFLLMIVVGIVTWMITGFANAPLPIQWLGAAVASLLLAALTMAAWNVVASRRPVASALWLAVIFVAAIASDIFCLEDWIGVSSYLQTAENIDFWAHDLVLVPLLYGEFALLLLIGIGLVRAAFSCPEQPRRQLAARSLLTAVLLAAAVPLATLYGRMTGRPDFPPPLKLAENVLPEIVRIGAPMERATPPQATAIHQQLLLLLERPGHATLDETEVADDSFADQRWERADQVRVIARAMDRHGEMLDQSGKREEAVLISFSLLKLSQMQARGGLLMDVCMGAVAETIGRNRLAMCRDCLSHETKKDAVRLLSELDTTREPMELVARREHAYYSRGMPWRFALERQLPYEFFGLASQTGNYIHWHLAYITYREQAGRQLLMTDLAIRLFQEDRGRLPRSLDELVPDYLAAVPIDPYGNMSPGVDHHVPPTVCADCPQRTLTYRSDGDRFLLYSVGHDCTDNGGSRMLRGENILTTGVDWDVESLIFKR